MSFKLPEHPQSLCFPISVLLEEEFSIDEFVSSCKKRVSIETLKNDLESYYKTLKNSMVELINQDYADFVKLSSNLIGVDKAIEDLTTPLGQLREEVLSLKLSLDVAIGSMDSRLSRRVELREKRALMNNLLSISESIGMLERLLQLNRQTPSLPSNRLLHSDNSTSVEEFTGLVQDRIASEFSRLQYLMSLSNQHAMINSLQPRIHSIEHTIECRLEKIFLDNIGGGDSNKLMQCLRTYATIGKHSVAEELFSNKVVSPYMEEVLTSRNLTTKAHDLALVYSEVLNFVPAHCRPLLQAISHVQHGHAHSNQRVYDFLINAVFPEIVRGIETRLSIIFAPGNPDVFYKNYRKTSEFINQFEELCSTHKSVQRLRSHTSYSNFLNKWSFPVYYQIRFQEIAGMLESVLSSSCEPAIKDAGQGICFKLKPFAVTWQCVCRCWEEGVFINPLVHRFWKLSVQLLTRLAVWLEGDDEATNLSISQCVGAISDCILINDLMNDFYKRNIENKIPLSLMGKTQFCEGLTQSAARLLMVIPNLKRSIVQVVSKQCCQNLEPTHTIPRLYRRTNKEVPSKPSSYVAVILKPLQSLLSEDMSLEHSTDVCSEVLVAVSERYLGIISDVLMSVKRTEDSLKKLKQRGRRSHDAIGGTASMSDDDKIRLQLSLDVEAFVNQVESLQQVSITRISALQQLLEKAVHAKEIASIRQ